MYKSMEYYQLELEANELFEKITSNLSAKEAINLLEDIQTNIEYFLEGE